MSRSIVLVAGLGGDHRGTWQARDKTLWPIDLLPVNLEDEIRVLSFQYNTTIRGTTDKAKIADHALELLSMLYDNRGGESDTSAALQPIIFVGHSLGGMLIKKVCIPTPIVSI